MKVKLFQYDCTGISVMENEINEFIKDKKIIDIKYSSFFEGPKKNFDRIHEYYLIMYEDN